MLDSDANIAYTPLIGRKPPNAMAANSSVGGKTPCERCGGHFPAHYVQQGRCEDCKEVVRQERRERGSRR